MSPKPCSCVCSLHGSGTSCDGRPGAPSLTITAHGEKQNALFYCSPFLPPSLTPLCNTPLKACCFVCEWEAFRNESEKLIMCGWDWGAALQKCYMWNTTQTHTSEQMCWWCCCLTIHLQAIHLPKIITLHMPQHTLIISNYYEFWVLIQVPILSQSLCSYFPLFFYVNAEFCSFIFLYIYLSSRYSSKTTISLSYFQTSWHINVLLTSTNMEYF